MSFFGFGDFSRTPPRPVNARSPPIVPFSTSPSQLQEVTLEHDGTFSNTMDLRSPGGPMRGRSVKEFEEQLTHLKKENFNLKLRIYFLEEKMGTNFTLDKDNIVKKYIELQVDFANQRKELEEKQELLCQAVKAIELEDEEHKKYVSDKQDQLNLCQQEIEDLRIQLQDFKYDSEGASQKSSDITRVFVGKPTHSGSLVNELQEKIKTLENELHLEKENNASFQFIICQTETLKTRCENMQKEIQAKEEIIKNLYQENDTINAKVIKYSEQIRELQEALDESAKENQNISIKMISDNKKYEEVVTQYSELKKKYATVKGDLEREHKRTDRVKTRITELEDENEQLNAKYRDTQSKLEAAVSEIRKNQNLAVSKSPTLTTNRSHTDVASISVPNATASPGTPQKDAFRVQVVSSSTSSGTMKSSSSSSICLSPSSSSDKFNIDFEELVTSASDEKILSVITSLKNDYDTQRNKLFKLKTEQFKACEIIKNMIDSRNKANDEIQQYKSQIKNLERELESVVSKPTSDGESAEPTTRSNNETSLEEAKIEEVEMAELYKALTVELEAKIKILEATLTEKDSQLQKIRDQYDDLLASLQEKDDKITELEFEVISSNSGYPQDKSYEKGDVASEKRSSFYKKELEEKNKEIEKLNVELKKCSCYLQEIVNKELWDKNKEIEKLHCRQVNSPEILKLKKDLTGKEQQLKVLKEKISELGLDLNISCDTEFKDFASATKIQHIKSLQDELKACKDEKEYFINKIRELEGSTKSEIVVKLKAQVESLTTDLQKSEKLRKESNDVCSLLSSRLEELAIFLDSLLKQKSILGFLGIHKERRLREIINTSLDLSKSFNMSFNFNPEQSLAQLSNITSVLNGSAFKDISALELQDTDDNAEVLSIVPGNITLTYQSHLYKQNKRLEPNSEEVITALREQIVNLKSELQVRDNELSRLNTKFSETDEEQRSRNLSGYAKELSRVYVTPQKSNTTSTTLKYQSDCASESEGWSEPDRTVSRARIGLSQTAPVGSAVKVLRLSESTDDENLKVESLLYNKREDAELLQEINDLKLELAQKIDQLTSAEERLLNVVAKDVHEDIISNLNKLRVEAEAEIAVLKGEIEALTKAGEGLKQSLLLKDEEIENMTNLLELEKTESNKISNEFEKVIHKANEDQMLYENKEKDLKQLENQLRKDLEELATRLEVEQQKLKIHEMETAEQINQIKEEYNNNYVNKSEVEQKLAGFDNIIRELDDLKEMVRSYESTIEEQKLKEHEYNVRVAELLEKINCLRKDLDITTLDYSESLLEKTKLASEKTILEQELSRYSAREKALQKQKSELQIKVSVLESNNAELHNRFAKIQAPRSDLSATMPNLRCHSGVTYNRHFSHPSFSSEDNLEECSGYNVNGSTARSTQPVDGDRQEVNASPDLGIESDQGRFSSLEMHANNNISRPLLQTIELTETMNNMLDGDNNPVRDVNCDGHSCQRTLEITSENNELKRKLLRMRRALEETANQLNLANQRKKEVEKTICKQIHKTSQVLRKAKANLDSGSEC